MDDNSRPHRTLAVEELLESEDITRMDWPVYSPDLNPIEHVWYALGRRITARLHHPENTQLKQMLIEEWVLLPQEMLHQLVLSPSSRGVKVTNSQPVSSCQVICSNPGLTKIRRVEGLIQCVNFVQPQSPHVGMVRKFEEWDVSSRVILVT
ncbi:transposable element Tc1 transposase [Trichonephila clavipes]|nr:transposable element Tc1 transposase [Trichonephila clavipes]